MAKYDVQFSTPETPGVWLTFANGTHLTFRRAKALVLDALDKDADKAYKEAKANLEEALDDAYTLFETYHRFAVAKPVNVQGYRYRIVRDYTCEPVEN